MPNAIQFSHPPTEPVRTSTPVRDETAHENLFREPEFAPGTAPVDPAELLPAEPAPTRRWDNDKNAGRTGVRRTTRRRSAA